MAQVDGLTAERMLEIEAGSVVGGTVNEFGQLILQRHDGTIFNAGVVKGEPGQSAPQSVANSPESLALRSLTGTTQFSDPLDPLDAANKQYVDSKFLPPTLGSGVDLNNVKTPGVYVSNYAAATSGTNYPEAMAGLLEVFANSDTNPPTYFWQRYTPYQAGASRIWIRAFYGTWSSWQRIDSGANPAWTAIALSNGWANYGGAYATMSVAKVNNRVTVRGMMKSGTTASGTVFGTIPAGFRPLTNIIVPVTTVYLPAVIEVAIDGAMTLRGSNHSATWVSMGTFSYLV